jgi:hypothetical protein
VQRRRSVIVVVPMKDIEADDVHAVSLHWHRRNSLWWYRI